MTAAARPLIVVWLVLMTASLAGFVLAEGLAPARVAATLAIGLALFKIHLVFDHFMELRWQHRPLRALLAAWLAAVGTILIVGYWAA